MLFLERLSRLGIRPRIVLELDSWETIREAVASGLGFGIVLEDEFTPDPRIRKIDLAGAGVKALQYFVCMPDFRNLRPLEAFFRLVEWIRNEHPADAQPVTLPEPELRMISK
jgi:DNA-binding transcriptional LysR family regulator